MDIRLRASTLALSLALTAGLGLVACGADGVPAGGSGPSVSTVEQAGGGPTTGPSGPTAANPSETPTEAPAEEPSETPPEAPTATNPPGVQCLDVPPAVVTRLVAGTRHGLRLELGRVFAQESDTRSGWYFLSLQVHVHASGRGGTPLPILRGLPVWVLDEAAWDGGRGTVLAANPDAGRLTRSPSARHSALHLDPADPDVGNATACSLL